ncbi:MAG: type II toxin-antitoxin system HicB family antitoxin [Muribaculaceae bacterium]|nr:type II toxin-antitoxin system HicB family antitoxin [Muribaculaceae bacterium]
MNTLKYKGFLGSVAFSEVDNAFLDKIEGIDGLVNFEGESVAEPTNAFQEAVEDYLEYCKEEGIEPHKSYSGSFNVRITPDLHSRIAYLAKQTGVSINSFIRTALDKQVAAML